MSPLCFIIMPFGKKKDSAGREFDFDRIYKDLIFPAVKGAGMEPIRADQEVAGGFIHKPMYERLLLCDFAVADLSSANANVFYELGIRHAVKPHTTISIFESAALPPFDVRPLRALPYTMNADGSIDSLPEKIDGLKGLLVSALKDPMKDSPIEQLLNDYKFPDLAHLKADVFREQVEYSEKLKSSLREARAKGKEAVAKVGDALGDKSKVEYGVLVDLYLSYRDVKDFERMISLYDELPKQLAQSILIREQYALAQNRMKNRTKAIQVLEEVVKQVGVNPETNGLLGRVYKDMWSDARKEGNAIKAQGFLNKACEMYFKGFEADCRDFYPGINALTLMDCKNPQDKRFGELLPVVKFAVNQYLNTHPVDYWSKATQMEVAVLEGNQERAIELLGECLAENPPMFNRETTANNLRLLQACRQERGAHVVWVDEIVKELEGKS